MNNIKIIKSLKNSDVLKREIKKQCGFLAPLLAPMAASLVEGIFGKGVMRAGRGVIRSEKG